jgi:hypothetical protein
MTCFSLPYLALPYLTYSLTLTFSFSVVVATYTVTTTNITFSVRSWLINRLRILDYVPSLKSSSFSLTLYYKHQHHTLLQRYHHIQYAIIQDIKNGTTEGTASGALTDGMQSYYKNVDIKTSGLPYGMYYYIALCHVRSHYAMLHNVMSCLLFYFSSSRPSLLLHFTTTHSLTLSLSHSSSLLHHTDFEDITAQAKFAFGSFSSPKRSVLDFLLIGILVSLMFPCLVITCIYFYRTRSSNCRSFPPEFMKI